MAAQQQRASVSIAVPSGKATESGQKPPPWEVTDTFTPSVSVDTVSALDGPHLVQSFLSGVSQDRVILHKSLTDGFETAVTLADPQAFKAIVTQISAHFAALRATSASISSALATNGFRDASVLVGEIDSSEQKRLDKVLALLEVRMQVVRAQFEGDAELKTKVARISQEIDEISEEINSSMSELRAEAADMDME
mmetsp:Transcript_13722/g.36737  ORF Transcript_13722/g.36737 Transcript_13722/m.36737 type:complete len:195 (+) Transcript_13722:30-614(+)